MPAVTAEELGLHHIFSDSSRGSAAVAFNFLEYLRNERGVSASYEVRAGGAERWGCNRHHQLSMTPLMGMGACRPTCVVAWSSWPSSCATTSACVR